MSSFLENLRRKSRDERHAYAISFSLIFTALVFSVWFLARSFESKEIALSENELQPEEQQNIATPIATVKDGLQGIFRYVNKEFSNLKNHTETFITDISDQNEVYRSEKIFEDNLKQEENEASFTIEEEKDEIGEIE